MLYFFFEFKFLWLSSLGVVVVYKGCPTKRVLMWITFNTSKNAIVWYRGHLISIYIDFILYLPPDVVLFIFQASLRLTKLFCSNFFVCFCEVNIHTGTSITFILPIACNIHVLFSILSKVKYQFQISIF